MTDSFPADGKFDINVALKIVRHISSGIYRDRPGSLRELISNCFDAQATEVSIQTGYPRFDTITIHDNGFGINEVLIRKAFTQVGLSLKVTDPDLYRGDVDRPVIGRFGIGFLSAAHISHDVWIRSFPKDADYGVEAKLDLEPYFLYKDTIETFDQFKFGTVQVRRIKKAADDIGTTIELRGVRLGRFFPVISAKGAELVHWPGSTRREDKPGAAVHGLVEAIQSTPNMLYVDRLCGREQVLWHLAMSCPVRYLDDGPIRSGYGDAEALETIRELRRYNESLRFRVWYDGIELRKPILLPTTKPGTVTAEDPDLPDSVLLRSVNVSGQARGKKKIDARGFLFYQPWRIVPAETRGMYPRIAGVGVGNTFENRFLSYLSGEHPILRVQICGELYIMKGLDEALNLDRSGFMELDPEFTYLAEQAGHDVRAFFAVAKSKSGRERRKKVSTDREASQNRAVEAVRKLSARIGQNYSVRSAPEIDSSDMARSDFREGAAYPSMDQPLVFVDHRAKRLTVAASEGDERLAELAVLVDFVLGKYLTDPQLARREFARELRKILQNRD